MTTPKFFNFRQNGIFFKTSKTYGANTVIQANDLQQAIDIAERNGVDYLYQFNNLDCKYTWTIEEEIDLDAFLVHKNAVFQNGFDSSLAKVFHTCDDSSIIIHYLNGITQYAEARKKFHK